MDELTFGNTALDLSAGILRCGSKSVRLSAREFDVMRILLQAKGGQRLEGDAARARLGL